MREAIFEEICRSDAQQSSSRINMRKTKLKHIMVKWIKTKGKRKIVIAIREWGKRHISFR